MDRRGHCFRDHGRSRRPHDRHPQRRREGGPAPARISHGRDRHHQRPPAARRAAGVDRSRRQRGEAGHLPQRPHSDPGRIESPSHRTCSQGVDGEHPVRRRDPHLRPALDARLRRPGSVRGREQVGARQGAGPDRHSRDRAWAPVQPEHAEASCRRCRRACGDLRRTHDVRPAGAGRQDPHQLECVRRAAGGVGQAWRGPGPGRHPAALRRDHHQLGGAGGPDAGRDRRGRGQAHRRRPARHDHVLRSAATPAVPRRVQAQEPVRLRHPPVEPGVPAQHRAPEHDLKGGPAGGHGWCGEGHRLRSRLQVQPCDRHRLADRRRGRGLAHHCGWHPEAAARTRPRVHLLAATAGC